MLAIPVLAACGGAQPPGGGFPPGGPPPAGAPDQAAPAGALFISPFGEPFRMVPDNVGGGPVALPWPSAVWFAGADADGDGVVTFAEFEADGLRWFRQLDADRDGRINPAEVSAYETLLETVRGGGQYGGPGQGGGRRGPPPGRGASGLAPDTTASGETSASPAQSGPGGGLEGRGGRRNGGDRAGGERRYGRIADAGWFGLPQPILVADANTDQTITAQEWAQATQRWFSLLDADRDGRLTLETLPQTRLQQRAGASRPEGRPPGG